MNPFLVLCVVYFATGVIRTTRDGRTHNDVFHYACVGSNVACVQSSIKIWPRRLKARTVVFHTTNQGSIPYGVTMTAIKSIYEEVECKANARFLDVIDMLIARRPNCRRLAALRAYVHSKLVAHRQKKRERHNISNDSLFVISNTRGLSHWELKQVAKSKRADYYETSCDCGFCKLTSRNPVTTVS